MYRSVCLLLLAWVVAMLVFPGVPARSGDSFSKDNITVRQGGSAVLRCSVDSKVSRVAWLNRTTILFAGEEKWSLDPRVILLDTVQTEYSIKIENVDLQDEGPYVCSILSDKLPKSTKVHLIVQVPAKIVNISTDITVNEGSNVTLMCLAIGRPDASIIWKHRSSSGVPTSRFITEGEYVEITAITKEQSGVYECMSTNYVSAPDVKIVRVTVNYPPVISRARNSLIGVGQRGMLQCEASAVPLADFEWYKEDRKLLNGPNGVKIENKGKQSMLSFFNVSEEDYGNYTCVAMNTMGITNASIILYGPGMHDMIDINSAVSHLPSYLLLMTLVTAYFLKF
ncbi:opioid-binding protein/cell adhesion molecule isoform X2 [Clupea harengus]|uniref:Opioid-binding protein/cell adhesion molecule isoform X2 n=1 Tax=Clupea harengus TaxID=7950 RepID=A0A6P8FX23_CLUHA|nr:opioid-binding protein/cell adhesion molecule isoform X2 [Clupea harengus]